MGKYQKFSKEVKIVACEKYHNGNGSFNSIAKEIGCHKELLRRWYYKYIQHGPSAFDISSNNRIHDKEFKISIIESYLSGNYSLVELSTKHNIATSIVQRWIQKYNNGIEIKSYDPKGEVYTMKSRTTTYEERLEIVTWVISNQMNYKEAAKRYGINYAIVYKWTKSYLKVGEESLQYNKRGPKSQNPTNLRNLSEVEELRQALEKETALRKRRELEIEVLKKKRGIRKESSLSKVRQTADYLTVDYFKELGYSISMVCEMLGISRSAYYKNKNRINPEKENQDALLCNLIQEYHSTFDGILGYRRLTIFINRLNQRSYSKGYIHHLMQYLGISARIRRKKVNRKPVKPDYIAENILGRNFSAQEPNEKWLTDVTEFSISVDSRKLYLSPIMDLYDNCIIEFELSFKNTNQLVFKMFDRAIQRYPEASPIFHSDRGFQYTSAVFKTKIQKAGMTQSMSRVGKCIDNGPMEGFFGTLKSEMFYGKDFKSMEELIQKIKNYIHFYNEQRFQKRLGCLTPIEYRNQASNCA